jgi:hypothetical protein
MNYVLILISEEKNNILIEIRVGKRGRINFSGRKIINFYKRLNIPFFQKLKLLIYYISSEFLNLHFKLETLLIVE